MGTADENRTAARHRSTGLVETVLLAAAVNLIIGVTLATSAAMVTGVHGETDSYYAVLQAAGAIATVVILFATAHAPASLQVLGVIGYAMIFAGGAVSGLASHAHVYALGFVLIIGFEKMFSVFIRCLRMKIIPREDLGKTTGLIIMLNNLSQPLAGLLISLFAGLYGAGTVIVALSLFMGLLGPLVAAIWLRRTARTVELDQR